MTLERTAIPNNLIDRVEELEKRLADLTSYAVTPVPDPGGGDTTIIVDGKHVIQDEGTDLTARTHLNFVGIGVTATDDATNDATVLTVGSTTPTAHDIAGALHTITGAALALVGATSLNTLGLITPSYNPGAASAVLKSDTTGQLLLTAVDTYPLKGTSTNSYGVYGQSTNLYGVAGQSTNSTGTYGYSTDGHGVDAISINHSGLYVSTQASALYAAHVSNRNTAAGIKPVLKLDFVGSGANSDGGQALLTGKSASSNDQSMASIKWQWFSSTHISRKADLILSAFDTDEREGLRIRGAGSAAAIGFYGVTPAARPSAYTVSNPSADRAFDVAATSLSEVAAVLGTLVSDLQTLGLVG